MSFSVRPAGDDGRHIGMRGGGRLQLISPGFNARPVGAGCKFIDGDDFLSIIAQGGDPYCGVPVSGPGSPWCDHHRARCWVKPKSIGSIEIGREPR
jgi:hypothetical protein